MSKAILFGANGYLGRHIAYFLKKAHIDFIPTDINEYSIDRLPGYRKIDITNPSELHRINFNTDYIFAFAGLTGTDNSPETRKKFLQVNEQGLHNILDCCTSLKTRVIFPSTRLVYKGVPNTALSEDAEKEAKTIYAQNKLNCEDLLRSSGKIYTIFRICVPYANLLDNKYSYGTIGFFLNQIQNQKPIVLYGDGSSKRTFTHVYDIVNIILKSLSYDRTTNQTFNIGSNDSMSLLDVANCLCDRFNSDVIFKSWPTDALEVETGDTIFSDKKLTNTIGYTYKYTIKSWIKSLSLPVK